MNLLTHTNKLSVPAFLLVCASLLLIAAPLHAAGKAKLAVPSSVERVETRSLGNKFTRLIINNSLFSDYFYNQPKTVAPQLTIELWDSAHNERISQLVINDNLVIDESAWPKHDLEKPLKRWSLTEMDDFHVRQFSTTSEEVSFELILFPTGTSRLIMANCASKISSDHLENLQCVEISGSKN